MLATDELIGGGGALSAISKETMDKLNNLLPAAWSHNNPIDILGDAAPEVYAKALDIAADDPNSDGLLVILTPQAMTDPTQTAEAAAPLRPHRRQAGLASWMGGTEVVASRDILSRADIPTFDYPDDAATTFNYMWQYT